MARPLRIEFAGALYHVTARGNARGDIYLSDSDRQIFLDVLGQVCERFNWQCHAYCLMSNHYHLLLETPDANLSAGMRQLNGVYTQTFNRNHTRVGHVFQGRYKAILVEKERYLLELSRYIVLNPVRAHMVGSAADWPWSSYRAMVAEQQAPAWLTTRWILSQFADVAREAMVKYQQFVADGLDQPSPWTSLKSQIYLGSENFVQNLQKNLDSSGDLRQIPLAQRRPPAATVAHYLEQAGDRDRAICLAYASGGYSMQALADYFGLHYSRVSRIVNKAKGKT